MGHNNKTMIPCSVVYQRQTVLAWIVTETDDEKAPQISLPKSQCEHNSGSLEPGEVVEFDVPEWLALEKGLI